MRFKADGTSRLLLSASKDGTFAVMCLFTNKILHTFGICESVFQMFLKDDRVLLRGNKFRLFAYDFAERSAKALEFQEMQANNLVENAKRNFVTSKSPQKLEACLRYIENDTAVFKKVNLTSLVAFGGNSQALKVACDKFEVLQPNDNVSLIQTCMRANDVDCLAIILAKMGRQDFYIDQGSIKVLLGMEQDGAGRAILEKQIVAADTEQI